jgi:hypothetical protein
MQKSYLDVTIMIAMLFPVIALYPLLPMLACGKQLQQDLFPFSYPTITATIELITQQQNIMKYFFRGYVVRLIPNMENEIDILF